MTDSIPRRLQGYAVVLGVGGAFALLMVLIMRIQARYSDIKSDNAAEFTCKFTLISPAAYRIAIRSLQPAVPFSQLLARPLNPG